MIIASIVWVSDNMQAEIKLSHWAVAFLVASWHTTAYHAVMGIMRITTFINTTTPEEREKEISSRWRWVEMANYLHGWWCSWGHINISSRSPMKFLWNVNNFAIIHKLLSGEGGGGVCFSPNLSMIFRIGFFFFFCWEEPERRELWWWWWWWWGLSWIVS